MLIKPFWLSLQYEFKKKVYCQVLLIDSIHIPSQSKKVLVSLLLKEMCILKIRVSWHQVLLFKVGIYQCLSHFPTRAPGSRPEKIPSWNWGSPVKYILMFLLLTHFPFHNLHLRMKANIWNYRALLQQCSGLQPEHSHVRCLLTLNDSNITGSRNGEEQIYRSASLGIFLTLQNEHQFYFFPTLNKAIYIRFAFC